MLVKSNFKRFISKKAAVSQKVDTSLYRNFYEIFTSSFADSNHDGEGDLNGVTQHLDYLNTGNKNSTTDLKVQGLWMTPIFASQAIMAMMSAITKKLILNLAQWLILKI